MEHEAAYATGLIVASIMGAGYYVNRAHTDGVRKRAIALGFLIALPLRLLLSRAFAFFAQVQYLLPARLDDELSVSVELLERGRASLLIAQEARRGDIALARGRIRIGCVDAGNFRPRRIPNFVMDILPHP